MSRDEKIALAAIVISLIALAFALAACANPRRFDPSRQQQLQKQQEDCLRRGGNPQECRP